MPVTSAKGLRQAVVSKEKEVAFALNTERCEFLDQECFKDRLLGLFKWDAGFHVQISLLPVKCRERYVCIDACVHTYMYVGGTSGLLTRDSHLAWRAWLRHIEVIKSGFLWTFHIWAAQPSPQSPCLRMHLSSHLQRLPLPQAPSVEYMQSVESVFPLSGLFPRLSVPSPSHHHPLIRPQ